MVYKKNKNKDTLSSKLCHMYVRLNAISPFFPRKSKNDGHFYWLNSKLWIMTLTCLCPLTYI